MMDDKVRTALRDLVATQGESLLTSRERLPPKKPPLGRPLLRSLCAQTSQRALGPPATTAAGLCSKLGVSAVKPVSSPCRLRALRSSRGELCMVRLPRPPGTARIDLNR